jgi:chemosensory pili system protein ChpC
VTTTRDELYAVLVSLATDTLLLPNVAVQEVVAADRIEAPAGKPPAWYAGRITHQNVAVPIVRFEVLNGGMQPEEQKRTRIAIVNAVSNRLRTGLYGVICQGYPHLVTLNRTALQPEPLQVTDRKDLVLSRVSIANTSALIPNLEAIEVALAQVEANE